MRGALSVNPTSLMAEHLAALRAYARRVLLEERALTTNEEQDKDARMGEFMATANSYKCTEKEMVGLVFKGVLK